MCNKEDKNTKNNFTSEAILELFPIQNKKVEISYTGEKVSSDGVALLLKEIDNR